MCNKAAFQSNKEVKDAEKKLLKYVRLTDTNQIHDTLTVKEDLIKDIEFFYRMARIIVG